MPGIIILSILFTLFVSYYIIPEGGLAKRLLPWGEDAGRRKDRNNISSTNDRPIQAGIPSEATCYRIQEIPKSVTEEELQRQLAPTVDEQEPSNLHLNFARSFGNYQTATFISTGIPRSLEFPIDTGFFGITPLYEAEDAEIEYENPYRTRETQANMCSIIAVHGLGSHAIGGFKSKGTSHVWLRDSLPHDIPNSRILLYGYDSSIMNKDHKISISGLGKTSLNAYKTFRKDTKVCEISLPWQSPRDS